MHNGRVPGSSIPLGLPLRRPLARRLTAALASAALISGLAAGCSGDDAGEEPDAGSSSSGSPSASGSESGEAYLPVPSDVELTEQGSELSVGDTAVVAWEPRQDQVGALEITVQRLEKTTFEKSFVGWKLDPAARRTTPYFVRAKVSNVGETDVGGRRVPLYIVDAKNTLVEYSTFASTFKPCDSRDFPAKFGPGATRTMCLVYLAPDKGSLTAVSFRPTQDFDPITWTGEVVDHKPTKPGKAGKKKPGKQKKPGKRG